MTLLQVKLYNNCILILQLTTVGKPVASMQNYTDTRIHTCMQHVHMICINACNIIRDAYTVELCKE